jgi:adenylate cyclase
MDGLTLLARLAETCTAAMPATMIVSAYGDMANIRTAMNLGAFDFVTKPIDFADFEVTLHKTLRHVTEQREARRRADAAERAHAALSRYFSPRLAEQLVSDSSLIENGGQRRAMAVLFTDIAGFTSLAESLDTIVLGRLLNEYLGGMTDIVFAHDGTVAKIVGDGLHILFGAPISQIDHAARAVTCARDLDAFAEALRERWRGEGVTLGATRIGLHAGNAIVGNFGGGRFFDYTAYGDTINIAARLEAANKVLGTRVCVSQAIVEQVEGFAFRPVGELVLRGRVQFLRAYEPVGPPEANTDTAKAYGSAFGLLAAQDLGALPAFASLVGQCPDDRLAHFHLRRLLNGEQGIRIEIE